VKTETAGQAITQPITQQSHATNHVSPPPFRGGDGWAPGNRNLHQAHHTNTLVNRSLRIRSVFTFGLISTTH
jgi:hypothetical protein